MIWWSDATFYQFASMHAFFGLPDLMPIGHFINCNAASICKWSVSHLWFFLICLYIPHLDMRLIDQRFKILLSCEFSFPCYLCNNFRVNNMYANWDSHSTIESFDSAQLCPFTHIGTYFQNLSLFDSFTV